MLKLAYWIELNWLLIDAIGGFLQNNGITLPANLTLGAVFRICVLIIFAIIVIKHPKGSRVVPIILFPLLIFSAALHGIYWNLNFVQVLGDVQFQMKIVMAILLYSVIEIQLKKGVLTLTRMKGIILVNAIVLLINLYLGIVGIGFGSYGVTADGDLLGSKGFFYAGNEVSITLVAIYALVGYFYRDYFRLHIFRFLIIIFLFFIGAMSTLSKTAILGFVLVSSFGFVSYFSRRNKLRFIGLAAFLFGITYNIWLPLLNDAIERWQYFYNISANFWAFASSGRSDRINLFFSWFADAQSVLPLIIGHGQLNSGGTSFENDLFDLVTKSGVLGVIIYLIWGAAAVWNVKKYVYTRNIDSGFAAYMLLLILFISVLTGHVMYSAMGAPFIAIIAIVTSRYFPVEKSV